MTQEYQARWVSKKQAEELRRSGRARDGVLLDSFNGFLLIEPVGSDLGDGPVLSREEAEFELQPVWCTGSKSRLAEARRLLGLEAAAPAEHLAASR
jgi:hypothetical protein